MHELRPLAARAQWAVIALVAVIVTDVIAIGSDWLEIDLMNRLLDGELVEDSELDSNDTRQGIVAVIVLAVYVASIVFFIRWFHAAYSNLHALGQTALRFKPGWAIGAWFVPILNLWRPKQIANDIWRGSEPGAPPLHQDAWKSAPIPSLLTAWWAVWIAATYIGNFAFRTWFNTDTAEEIRTAAYVDMVSLLADVAAAVLAILVVRALTERQTAHAGRFVAVGAPAGTIPAA